MQLITSIVMMLGVATMNVGPQGTKVNETQLEIPGDQKWVKYEAPEGGFSVKFPTVPEVSSDDIETDIGLSTLQFYMSEMSSTEVYMVSFNEYAEGSLDGTDAKDLLEGGRDGAMGSLGIEGTEVEERFEYKGYSGLYFKANNGSFFVAYRLMLVNNRLYQVAILREGKYPSEANEKRFFKSFKLTN